MKKPLRSLAFVAATLAAGTAMAGVTFFEIEKFQGRPLRADGVIPDLGAYGYNDRARSMLVDSPVEVCSGVNFRGLCQVYNPGEYPELGSWVGAISSVRPTGAARYDPHGAPGGVYAPGLAYERGYDPHDPRYQRGYGYDPRGYGYDPRGYGYDPRGYGYDPRGYDPRAQWGRNGYDPRDYSNHRGY